jgi:hypothetical protein
VISPATISTTQQLIKHWGEGLMAKKKKKIQAVDIEAGQMTAVTVPLLSTHKHYLIKLNDETFHRISKELKGQGGWQGIVAALQGGLMTVEGDQPGTVIHAIMVPQWLMRKIIPYATKHGGGGYQAVFRMLVCLWVAQFEQELLGLDQLALSPPQLFTLGKPIEPSQLPEEPSQYLPGKAEVSGVGGVTFHSSPGWAAKMEHDKQAELKVMADKIQKAEALEEQSNALVNEILKAKAEILKKYDKPQPE